jgi:hypothetical protein
MEAEVIRGPAASEMTGPPAGGCADNGDSDAVATATDSSHCRREILIGILIPRKSQWTHSVTTRMVRRCESPVATARPRRCAQALIYRDRQRVVAVIT